MHNPLCPNLQVVEGESNNNKVTIRRIPYPYFGVELMYGSMTVHCRQLHGMDLSAAWSQPPASQTEQLLLVYEVRFQTTMHSFQCPFQ